MKNGFGDHVTKYPLIVFEYLLDSYLKNKEYKWIRQQCDFYTP